VKVPSGARPLGGGLPRSNAYVLAVSPREKEGS
jgi:hypothetical protein